MLKMLWNFIKKLFVSVLAIYALIETFNIFDCLDCDCDNDIGQARCKEAVEKNGERYVEGKKYPFQTEAPSSPRYGLGDVTLVNYGIRVTFTKEEFERHFTVIRKDRTVKF